MQAFLIDIYASALNARTARCNRSAENKMTALSKKKSSICLPTHLLGPLVNIQWTCKVTTLRDIKFMGVYYTVKYIKYIFTYIIFLRDRMLFPMT